MERVFEGFVKECDVSEELIIKYSSLLPVELIDAWKKFGFGTFANGYLRMINPEDYILPLQMGYRFGDQAIPMFVTAFGDVITWQRNRYVYMINFKKCTFEGLAAGFDFFWEDLASGIYEKKFFDMRLYNEAVAKYGKPDFNECFGFFPLLVIGGTEDVDHLQKVSIKEHVLIMAQFGGVGI